VTEATPPRPGLRLHPVDLLVLLVAAGLASLVYAYFFRTTPVGRPVDSLLGATIEVEFRADRDWKRSFPAPGAAVIVEDFLVCDVAGSPAPGGAGGDAVRLSLRVRGREAQRPEAMTHFRSRLRRGTRVRLHDSTGEVEAEVLSVSAPPVGK
jgi:hypothetical protein